LAEQIDVTFPTSAFRGVKGGWILGILQTVEKTIENPIVGMLWSYINCSSQWVKKPTNLLPSCAQLGAKEVLPRSTFGMFQK